MTPKTWIRLTTSDGSVRMFAREDVLSVHCYVDQYEFGYSLSTNGGACVTVLMAHGAKWDVLLECRADVNCLLRAIFGEHAPRWDLPEVAPPGSRDRFKVEVLPIDPIDQSASERP